jgi:probable HAF family extracellular repeat protein
MTDLGTLGGSSSYACGINNCGQVVGVAETTNGAWHFFLYSGGVMTDLGFGGSPIGLSANIMPTGINNNGQIVGCSGGRAFVYSGGEMFDLNTRIPSTLYPWDGPLWLAAATAINDNGQIVGYDDNGYFGYQADAFLLNPLPVISFNLSGGSVTLAWPTNFASGFTLESTTNLASPVVWTALTNAPNVVNGQSTVTIPVSGTQMYFRLNQ